jgi:uncharacterized protein YqgV (UPF0045/DUF77 family)
MSYEKILTDCPLLDEIIYNSKIMAIGTVLKDQEAADAAELTLEMERAADMYINCVNNNNIRFDSFKYTYDFFVATQEINGISSAYYKIYADNNHLIPEENRPLITEIRRQLYIELYEEQNEYYRKLNGLPPLKDPGIYIVTEEIKQKYIQTIYNELIEDVPEVILTEAYKAKALEKAEAQCNNKYGNRTVVTKLPSTLLINIDNPIHKMSTQELDNLEVLGVIEELRVMFPTKYYLKHLGSKSISIIEARQAPRFGILYIPPCSVSNLYNKFKTLLERNRVYVLKTIYSDAFKLQSDYYDNFITMFIVVQTIIDMIVALPEYITTRDVFDIRTVQYFLEGFGVEFYREIPLKYQIRMVKNLNRLIKYKSTTKNIVDICSLFGYDDIQIFEYYLLRNRKKDDNGAYIDKTKVITDENTQERIEVEDYDECYELKFLQCPIEKEFDEVIRDKSAYLEYDDITKMDKYWDGEQDHDLVKSEIIAKEFNVLRSKYISIDTVQEMSEIAIQLPYFYNMLFDDILLEEQLKVAVPYISGITRFKFNDLICFLWSISYEYYNLKDNILKKKEQIMYLKGFNFNSDMDALSTYIASKGFTAEELGISDFIIPESSILTFNQLLQIFNNNLKVRAHIVDQLYNADNKKIYDIYKTIYDSLMVVEYTDKYFTLPDGTIADTYYDFLVSRDSTLSSSIDSIRKISDNYTKQEVIGEYISAAIYALEEFINGDQYKYLWGKIPTVSGDAIKKYVAKVINFFKSYKLEILGINTIYIFNDRFDNLARAIDKADVTIVKEARDYYRQVEHKYMIGSITLKDCQDEKMKIRDKVYIDIKRIIEKLYNDNYSITDSLLINSVFEFKDVYSINDNLSITPIYNET